MKCHSHPIRLGLKSNPLTVTNMIRAKKRAQVGVRVEAFFFYMNPGITSTLRDGNMAQAGGLFT